MSLTSQLTTGYRVLKRQGLHGLTAILGLAIGLMVAVIALLYAWQETHYDRLVPDADRLMLVDVQMTWPGRSLPLRATVPSAMMSAAMNAMPEVEAGARVYRQYSTIRTPNADSFNEIIAGVDPAFVDLIGLTMVSGDRTRLVDPSQVLLSTAMAERVFGTRDAVGKTLSVPPLDLTVAGVFEDFSDMSHLEMDVIMSIKAPVIRLRGDLDSDWTRLSVLTYLKLAEGASEAAAEATVQALMDSRFQLDEPLPDGMTMGDVFTISLESVAGLHLSGKRYAWGVRPPADMLRLSVLAAIAVLIVLTACINHVNMSTVRAQERAREVAIRKLMGAGRGALIGQFMLEAAVIASVALLAAIVGVEVTLPLASELLQTELDLNALMVPSFLAWLAALMVFVVLAAGAYPAVLASAFPPGRTLYKHGQGRSGGDRLRSALVVFQFAVSIVLAVGAATIFSQLKFAREADLGFKSEGVIMLYGVQRDPQGTINLTENLRNALSGRPAIEYVAGANSSPSWDYVTEVDVRRTSESPDAAVVMGSIAGGLDFFKVLDIQPVAGRTFSSDYGADRAQWDLEVRDDVSLPVVINERAARMLGYANPADAVGGTLQFSLDTNYDRASEIVGVVPDVHFESFRKAVRPMVFFPDPTRFGVMMVRYDTSREDVALASLKAGWSETFSSQALSMDFLSTALAEGYGAEAQELKTVSVLAGLGILIAIFGQYGLAAYSAQTRRREISIRKVLGARVRDILGLFAWQFSKPVLLANLVAWPVAFLAMDAWLETFVYRVTPNPLWFVLAGVAALIIALVTMAGHALSAAQAHPVEALRHD